MAQKEEYYKYTPSIAAAIITLIVFGILFGYHAFKLFKTKTWFCIPFVVGAILEIIGYGARAYGNSNPYNLGAYIIQSLFILLAPILFAASVYMFLSRIIRASGQPSYAMIRPNWLTKIFVGGDILCFLMQGIGGSIMASGDSKSSSDMGKTIILAGLILQIVIFGFFMVVGLKFHMNLRNSSSRKMAANGFNWEWYMNTLYAVSILITVRNVFRVIEYAMGEEAYLLANEWPIYVFDALLMAIVLVICCKWYIRELIDGATGITRSNFEMMGSGDPLEPKDRV
ncbi:RTA1-domain-containing protein [Corynespora cassiicola Philippines]|uniref:RTA1-domain-containing protein n=1 Tax=Corynespora cassiicola Philippines TaxID=1448308 RepID=A0A2T2NMS7_CORCC|nr:RTA1-domain-containing protein [Corynespora cassiicola Philippines]